MKCLICGKELNANTDVKCSECRNDIGISIYQTLFPYSYSDKQQVAELKKKYATLSTENIENLLHKMQKDLKKENERLEEQKRIKELNHKLEKQRMVDIKKAEEKIAAEKKAAEQKRKVEEARKAEQRKIDEQKRKQEQAKLTEQKRLQKQKEQERRETEGDVRFFRILGLLSIVVVIVLFFLVGKVGLWIKTSLLATIVYCIIVFLILGCGIFGFAFFGVARDEKKKLK